MQTNDPERERVEGVLLPPAAGLSEEYLEGWCDGQAYLLHNQRAALRPADGLVERLEAFANDPMWADHAEVPKTLLTEAATALRSQPDFHPGYAPCPLCGQYSHTLTEDRITDALMHFTAMTDHRGDGIGTQHVFDDKTRDAAQALVAAAKGEREAERAAIVAWLEKQGITLTECDSEDGWWDTFYEDQ